MFLVVMIIPINFPTSLSKHTGARLPPQLAHIGTEDIVLIELQGSLEVEGSRAGELVGKLHFASDDDLKPTLTIGHHLLEGKVVDLVKPLAVLFKQSLGVCKPTQPDEMDTPGALFDTSSAHANEAPVSYDVVGVVKKKIIFSKRPIPIVSPTSVGVTAL